jgi:hypothetical protein
MNGFWSFNRSRDLASIISEDLLWQGPYSWPLNKKTSELPNISGVYLFTFPYLDGYILYCAGITKSMKTRFRQHTSAYKNGKYTILDVDSATKGVRKEIWHGWEYYKSHKDEFKSQKKDLTDFIDRQLDAFKIFIVEVNDKRKRERIEGSIMSNVYSSKEPWADLTDRGMRLLPRYNNEMPILIKNKFPNKLYGVLETLEI